MADARFSALLGLLLYVNVCPSSTADDCGKARVTYPLVGRRLVGGLVTSDGEFPWQVELTTFGSTHCSGVLIKKDWVLTSARCFIGNFVPSHWVVSLGDYDKQRAEQTEVHVHVKNIVIHGDFTTNPYTNDVAMVQLAEQAKDFPSLCLPDSNPVPLDSTCFVSGWGATQAGSDFSTALRKLPVTVVERGQCAFPIHLDEADFMCASSRNNTGPCLGDTGAPLQCEIGDRWFTFGIVFDIFTCDTNSNTTHLYTSVKSYLPWIRKTMKLLSRNDVSNT